MKAIIATVIALCSGVNMSIQLSSPTDSTVNKLATIAITHVNSSSESGYLYTLFITSTLPTKLTKVIKIIANDGESVIAQTTRTIKHKNKVRISSLVILPIFVFLDRYKMINGRKKK